MAISAHPSPLVLVATCHYTSPIAEALLETIQDQGKGPACTLRLDVGADRTLDVPLSAQALADLTKSLKSQGIL
jgi:hypothetical protein